MTIQDDHYAFSFLDLHQNVAVFASDTTSSWQPHTQMAVAAAASTSPENIETGDFYPPGAEIDGKPPPRRKRRRIRSEKNVEEIENQRMTHIAVERNRRRQMNDLLFLLRSIMPSSYSQRGDQASIVGGAINYVKKLEQTLQSLEAHKAIKSQSQCKFSNFFIFPQYSTVATAISGSRHEQRSQAAVADVEVTMMERHANIKVLTKAQPSLVLKMVNGFYSLGLNILHLNLTTSQHTLLLTFSVKIEEASEVASVDEIANAVHDLVKRNQSGD